MKYLYTFLLLLGSMAMGYAQAPSAPQTNTANITNGCNTSAKLSVYSNSPPSGLTHKWYLTETGTQSLSQNDITIIPPGYQGGPYITEKSLTQSEDYWVAAVNSSGQESARTKVELTFTTPDTTPPNLSLGYTGEQCGPTATFSISAGGGGGTSTYEWYTTSNTSGTAVHTGSSFNPTLNYSGNGDTTYWVKATLTSTNCYVGTVTETDSIIVSFKDPVPTPSVTNVADCGPNSFNITASGAPAGASYRWYDANDVLISGNTTNSYNTGSLSVTTTYKVSIYDDGCEGDKATVTATINDIPAAPTVEDKGNACGLNTITLDATSPINSGQSHIWYTAATGSNTAPHQETSTVGQYVTSITVTAETKNFWVATKIGDCESDRVQVTATYTDNSQVPTLNVGDFSTNGSDCGPRTLDLRASGGQPGSSYRWYDAQTGGTQLSTDQNFAPTLTYAQTTAGSKTYWVEGSLVNTEDCTVEVTTRQSVTVTIQPVPLEATGSDSTPSCGSEPVTLQVTTGLHGTEVRWYDAPTGGNYLGTGNTFITPSITQTTPYYAETQNSTTGCAAPTRKEIFAIFGNVPSLTVLGGSNDCGSPDIQLTATSDLGLQHLWYTTQTGGTPITPDLISDVGQYVSGITVTGETKSYWVAASNGTCSSNRIEVTATYVGVGSTPDLTITDQSLSANSGCGVATFSLAASDANGGSPNNVYKWWSDDDPNAANPIFTGALYEPTVNYGNTTNGVKRFYLEGTLYNELDCEFIITTREYIDVVVHPDPAEPVGEDVNFVSPGKITLNIPVPGANSELRWYDANDVLVYTGHTFLTPVLHETTSYFVERYDLLSNCVSDRTEIKAIYFNPLIEPQLGSFSRCGTGTVELSATPDAQGNTIRWYSSAEGGTVLGTGTTYTTDPISGTTMYYAESYNAGTGYIETPRVPIEAVVLVEKIWYDDLDGDGLGDPDLSLSITDCTKPEGDYVSNNLDTCTDIHAVDNDCGSTFSLDENYVYSRSYQTKTPSAPQEGFFSANDNLIQQITYFDGLGRPIQQIGIDQNPDKEDIITHMDYDAFGRVEKEYLPYNAQVSANLGSFRRDAKAKTVAHYKTLKYGNTTNPYSEKELEYSPLGRVLKQAAPGEDWKLGNGHEIEFSDLANTHDPLDTANPLKDNVRLFKVDFVNDDTEAPALALGGSGYYLEGELFKTTTKDENHSGTTKNHTTEEFKDKQGRVVLKRTYADFDIDGSGSINAGETEVPHDTYYVYDDFGNLTYVLPPKMDASTATLTNLDTNMGELGYQYVYDYRNRLVEKKIPGKGWEYIVYNKLDQPVMTQDAVQKPNGEWLFTKYDAFGRTVYTGIYTHGSDIDRDVMQSDLDDHYIDDTTGDRNSILLFEKRDNTNTANYKYSNDTFPVNNLEILTVNYYDEYNFDLPTSAPTGITILGTTETNTVNVQGLATGSKVKVLDVAAPNNWINTVTYYDDKARPVYVYSKNNYLGTTDIMETQLDFVGKPQKSKTTHIRGTDTIVTIDNFTYDHTGRLLTQTQCIGDETLGNSCDGGTGTADLTIDGQTVTTVQTATQSITVTNTTLSPGTHLYIDTNGSGGNQELIVFNDYDVLGQLQEKKVGGSPNADYSLAQGLQTVAYTYNIRGWLTNINDITDVDPDKLFNFSIGYNQGSNPLYNGNISQTQWRTDNQDSSLKSYDYSYDPLNRITSAIDDTSDQRYSLTNITYDKNGNIQKLKRNGHLVGMPTVATDFGVMDDLTYSYTGNQLKAVDDDIASSATQGFVDGAEQATEYTYDGNGNVLTDANKGITDIDYNHWDLPILVDFGNGNNIEYIYDALGNKLKKKVTDVANGNKESEYAGNHIYENGFLKFFTHAEGYVQADGNGDFSYVYQYKDHLGNVRLSYSDNNNDGSVDSSEIIEEKNYYPFGLVHKGYNFNINGIQNDYLTYNGKEFDVSLDMNMYDLGARMMDPALGRFMVVDPMAVFVDYQSPYVVADNNPIGNVDEYGLGRRGRVKCKSGCSFFGRILRGIGRGLKAIGSVFKNKKNKYKNAGTKKTPKKKGSTGSTGGSREAITGLDINLQGIADLGSSNFNVGLPNRRGVLPIDDDGDDDEGDGVPDAGASITFDKDVKFISSSSTFRDVNHTDKTLNDLIITLKEHPQLKLLILGNVSFNTDRTITADTPSQIEGRRGTVGELQLIRARAVERFLINRGIDWKRLRVGQGSINTTGGTDNMSSTFKLSNPKE